MSIKVIQIRDKKIVAKINQSLNKVGKNKNTCQMSRKKYHYQTWDIYIFIGEPKSCSHFITNGAKLRLSYKYIHIPSLIIT
jgi:hypothetical protein